MSITEEKLTEGQDKSSVVKTYRTKRKIKKTCFFCRTGKNDINYKNVELLKKYCIKYNKIVTHKISGNCLKHQHQITNAIKRARFVALLPFVCD